MPAMFSRRAISTLALLAWISAASGQTTLQLDLGLWDMAPGGDLSVGADLNAGTDLDIEEDLGFDGSEKVWQARAIVGATHQFAVSYLAFEADANSTIEQDIRFGEFSYPVSTKVYTELQGDLMGLAYRYAGGSDTLRSGFLVGLELASLEVDVSASGIGKGKGDVATALPVIGVFAEWNPAVFLQLNGTVSGGAWDWQDTSVTFLDAEASVRVLLFPFFGGIGYRHLAVQGEDTSLPVELDLTFSGPLWFAGLLF